MGREVDQGEIEHSMKVVGTLTCKGFRGPLSLIFYEETKTNIIMSTVGFANVTRGQWPYRPVATSRWQQVVVVVVVVAVLAGVEVVAPERSAEAKELIKNLHQITSIFNDYWSEIMCISIY